MKAFSPEIIIIARGQGLHLLEASTATYDKGEYEAACRGLRPWQVIERFKSELGRAVPFLTESSQQAEEARRGYSGTAVGPAHIRGVAVVMRGEGMESTRRGRQQDAEGK